MKLSTMNLFFSWINRKLVNASISMPEMHIHGYRFSPLCEIDIQLTWEKDSVAIRMHCEWRSEISSKLLRSSRDAFGAYNRKLLTGEFTTNEQQNRLLYTGCILAQENHLTSAFSNIFSEVEQYGSKLMTMLCPYLTEEDEHHPLPVSAPPCSERKYAASSLSAAEAEKWMLPVPVSRITHRYQPLNPPDTAVLKEGESGTYCDLIIVDPDSWWRTADSLWTHTSEQLLIPVTYASSSSGLNAVSSIVCLKNGEQTIDVYEPCHDGMGILTSYYIPGIPNAIQTTANDKEEKQ